MAAEAHRVYFCVFVLQLAVFVLQCGPMISGCRISQSIFLCLCVAVWADDNWLQKHAGETLETAEEGEGDGEDASAKRPAEDGAEVSKFDLLHSHRIHAAPVGGFMNKSCVFL